MKPSKKVCMLTIYMPTYFTGIFYFNSNITYFDEPKLVYLSMNMVEDLFDGGKLQISLSHSEKRPGGPFSPHDLWAK